jgi:hypothetical protein
MYLRYGSKKKGVSDRYTVVGTFMNLQGMKSIVDTKVDSAGPPALKGLYSKFLTSSSPECLTS